MIERATAVGAGTAATPTRLDLIELASRGDREAFERLVATSVDRSFRTARAILGNDADARDATQDAFVSAWRHLPNLRNPTQFDAWFSRILVNACRGLLRRRMRVREISLDGTFDRQSPEAAISEQIGDADVLGRAFERLDADKRAVLVLHYLEHEPLAAIAAALGIPVGTLKWRMSEARAELGRALAAEGEAR
jgi:RNA polymerase sigma-70 factor (ECF subfamily)